LGLLIPYLRVLCAFDRFRAGVLTRLGGQDVVAAVIKSGPFGELVAGGSVAGEPVGPDG